MHAERPCREIYVIDLQASTVSPTRIERIRNLPIDVNGRLLRINDITFGCYNDTLLFSWKINQTAAKKQSGLFVRPNHGVTHIVLTEHALWLAHKGGIEGWKRQHGVLIRFAQHQCATVKAFALYPHRSEEEQGLIRASLNKLEYFDYSKKQWQSLSRQASCEFHAEIQVLVRIDPPHPAVWCCFLALVGETQIYLVRDDGAYDEIFRADTPLVPQLSVQGNRLIAMERTGRFLIKSFDLYRLPAQWCENNSTICAPILSQAILGVASSWYDMGNMYLATINEQQQLSFWSKDGTWLQTMVGSGFTVIKAFALFSKQYFMTGKMSGDIQIWQYQLGVDGKLMIDLKEELNFSAQIDCLEMKQRGDDWYLYTGSGSALGCWLIKAQAEDIVCYLQWCTGRRLLLHQAQYCDMQKPLSSQNQALIRYYHGMSD